ncbi:MAG: DUF3006 domain-containing protein [Ruminococcus sp.]|nr:DUF3006 domain-containing protein [Ruminococcus sp.]MCD7800300.1 DUF3006 domain-containing protein [Ruminococcus sp.]
MLIIDRFEGEYAILEDNNYHYEIKRSELPHNCKEGDVIVTKDGFYTIDVQQTKLRREAILKLQRTLWES